MGIEIRDIEEKFAERLPEDRLVGFDFSNAPADKNDNFAEVKGTSGNTIQDSALGWKVGGTVVGTLPTNSTAITGTTTNVNTLTPGVIYPLNNAAAAVKLVTTGPAKAGTFYFRITASPQVYTVTIGNEGLVGHSANVVFNASSDVGLVFALHGNATDGYSLEATPSYSTNSIGAAGTKDEDFSVADFSDSALVAANYLNLDPTGAYEILPETAGADVTVTGSSASVRSAVMLCRIGETTENNSVIVDSTDITNLSSNIVFNNGASDIGKVFAIVTDGVGNVVYIGPQEDEVNLQAPQSLAAQEEDFDIGDVVVQGDLTLVPIDTGGAAISIGKGSDFRGVALCTIVDTTNNVTLESSSIALLPGGVDLVFASGATANTIKFLLVGDGTSCQYFPLDVDYDTTIADVELSDPGSGGTITPVQNGWVKIVTAGAETRTLAQPSAAGITFTLCMETDGGDATVSLAVGFPLDQGGNNTMTFDDIGDTLLLRSVAAPGPSFRWIVLSNDGVTLSFVP